MTVIRYIANESKCFHTYVANRIAVREESNPSHWKYIMTASPIPLMKLHQELQKNTFIRNGLWVEGPDFLSSLEPQWEDGAQEYAIRRNVSTPRSIWVIGRITDFFFQIGMVLYATLRSK